MATTHTFSTNQRGIKNNLNVNFAKIHISFYFNVSALIRMKKRLVLLNTLRYVIVSMKIFLHIYDSSFITKNWESRI